MLVRSLDLNLRTHGPRAAFDRLCEARCLGTAEREAGLSPVPVDELSAWLAEHDAGALEWVTGATETLVCAIDAQGPRWYRLPALWPYLDSIVELGEALGSENDEATQPERSEELADQLSNVFLPACLLYTSPSPRDQRGSRMPSSA